MNIKPSSDITESERYISGLRKQYGEKSFNSGPVAEKFNRLGFIVCCWKLYVSLESASIGMGMECRLESNPATIEIVGQYAATARAYYEKLREQFSGVTVFLEAPDDDALKSLIQLLERFYKEVVKRLEDSVHQSNISAIERFKDVLQAIYRSCLEISDSAKERASEIEKLLYEEMCARAVSEHPPFKGTKCVVSVDLVEYGRMSDEMEGFLGAQGILLLNQRIQEVMHRALNKVSIPQTNVVFMDTGDGVLAILDDPDDAVKFAEAILVEVKEQNRGIESSHQIHLRTGVSSGNIVMQEVSTKDGRLTKYNMGGKAIATAVRLQAASRPGQILVDDKTHRSIRGSIKYRFESKAHKVVGKRHEKDLIQARSYFVYPTTGQQMGRLEITGAKHKKQKAGKGTKAS